jgi:serine/threonine protein kinase/formylglycine-generating enzyme required for sulfatase activity
VHVRRSTLDETQDKAPGDAEHQGETAPFVQGGIGDNSFVMSEGNDPKSIGRYRVIRRIGKGGFGQVYLAHDDDLDRPVAIKVPNPERISRPEDIEAYLNEARILASLDHPHIVPVFDLGRTEDGLCYVVSKYVEGSDLAARIRQSRPGFRESAELVAFVAEALHYAHTRGLVHRDVKPANILIDASGKPCVADFGLALRPEDYGRGAKQAGTPDYMSPEQARGEGHRVDGRSDIFSLGVVFYVLLTGRKPFTAPSRRELLDLIATTEARPPRQIQDTIPKELERICLKALAKRASERYTTARDMADDLGHFLDHVVITAAQGTPAAAVSPPPGSTQENTPPPITPRASDSDSPPIKIVPKGLRSFDEHDADFFLELLPGPRDREGLPDSLRFWKTRIETIDPDKTFRVGLIYGPSGCGKSSLVKAGLLPRLVKYVLTVYVEATPEETESRLLRALRKACPDLSSQLSLVDCLMVIRQGRVLRSGQKVLLVLDQFEQWLHARRGEENTELVNALRQCDGEHVQAVVMVRDDFWLAASRFMRNLEIRLLEGENSALVDLFDPRHAKKVLMAFGRAYGTLPEHRQEFTRDQEAFLDQSVTGLAQDGKVVPVRLALFSEMVKGKPWTPASFREVGGTEGVGVTFLEETFSATSAPPEHRLHQKASQAVLKALLPETGTDIKGQMRSRQELLEASGSANRPRDFDDLIQILDNELRLITPTDLEGSDVDQSVTRPGDRYYQLTHDYLVPSLRHWLTRKQRETRRGRAELRLAERSSLWNAKSENRHLPSLLEWANIRLLTTKKDWNEPQRRMMRRASRVHGLRTLGVATLFALLTWGSIEGFGTLRGSNLVDSLRTASTPDVPAIVRQLQSYRRWANPRLKALVQSADDESREKLHASLALLPVDPSQLPFLEKHLLDATPAELPVIRDALKPHRDTLTPKLWSVLDTAKPGDENLLPAASALADYDASSPRWESVGGKVAQALVTVNPVLLGPWLDALRPVRTKLTAPVALIFRGNQRTEGAVSLMESIYSNEMTAPLLATELQDKQRAEDERARATNILADYATDDPGLLVDLLINADPHSYAALFPVAERQATKTVPVFQAEIAKKATFQWNDPLLDPKWIRPDAALVSRIESAQGLLAERFAFCQTMPLDDFLNMVELLRPSGYCPTRCRPYDDGKIVRVTAVWIRDNREWRIVSGKTAAEVQSHDQANQEEAYQPIDVAGYLVSGQGTPKERYICVWMKQANSKEERRLFVGLDSEAYVQLTSTWGRDGIEQQSVAMSRNGSGEVFYTGIGRKPEQGTGGNLAWVRDQDQTAFENDPAAQPFITDLTLSSDFDSPTSLKRKLEDARSRLDAVLERNPTDSVSRLARARIKVCLGDNDGALPDLNMILEHDSRSLAALRLLGEIRLWKGQLNEAGAVIDRILKLPVGSHEERSWGFLRLADKNARNVTAQMERAAEVMDGDRIDLLTLVRPGVDPANGTWQFVDGSLLSPSVLGGRIELPCAPKGDYTLRLAVEPIKMAKEANSSLVIGLVMGARRFQATFDWVESSYIENVDGKNLLDQHTAHEGRVLEDGRTSILEIQVASGSIKASCDDRPIFSWKGDPSLLSLNDYWNTPNPVLFLGSYNKSFRFDSVVLEAGDNGLLSRPEEQKDWSLFKVHSRARRLCSSWGQKDLSEASRKGVIEHLSRLLASTPGIIETVKLDPALAPFLGDPSILSAYPSLFARYTYARRTSPEFVSACVFGLSPTQHLDRVRDLVRDGYRPAGIDAVSIGNTGPVLSASVWQEPVVTEVSKDVLAAQQARAAVALLRLGKVEEFLPLLSHSADPRRRSFVVNWLNPLGADPQVIAAELDRLPATARPTPVQGQQFMDTVLFHPETSQRRALILALGTYGREGLSPAKREPLTGKLLDLYRNDADSGIHGAAAWTLRQWGRQESLKDVDTELAKLKDRGDRRWFVNSQGQTIVLIEGPVEFLMGSPPTEPERIATDSAPHRMIIPHRFAIAAQEVTVEQYQGFVKENPGVDHANINRYSAFPNGPMNMVTWYDATAYCNWLSRRERLPECYEPNEQGSYAAGMRIKADALKLTGYRLPTEAEWEYACRSGAVTSRYYGLSIDLLGQYARFRHISQGRAWPCGGLLPNDLGLSDMLGNVWEWCQDQAHSYPEGTNNVTRDDMNNQEIVQPNTLRLLRGGPFNYNPAFVRSANCDRVQPSGHYANVGFRLARTYP